MIKNTILVVILFAISFWAKGCYDDGVASELREAAIEAEKIKISDTISDFSRKHNAITDWGEVISGGNLKLAPSIHTGTMQRVWLSGRPILFIGKVKDYSMNSNGVYLITLKSDILTRYEFPFLHKEWSKVMLSSFEMQVACPEKKVDLVRHILENTIEFGGPQIAAIVQVTSLNKIESNGESSQKFSGLSYCLDLIGIQGHKNRKK